MTEYIHVEDENDQDEMETDFGKKYIVYIQCRTIQY